MKFTNLLVVVGLFLMTSCGGEEGISPETTLVGSWELQDFTVKIESSTTFSNQTTTVIADVEGENLNYDLTFSDATYNTEGAYDYKLDAEVNGDKSSSNLSVSNVEGNGTYTHDGDELTIGGSFFKLEFEGLNLDIADEEATATIEKLTDKELILNDVTIENTTQEISGVSISVASKIESRSVWKRK